MFTVKYQQTHYCDVVKEIAAKMDVGVQDGALNIPSRIGNGYFKFKILSNGLQCLITNFQLNQDLYLSQSCSSEEFYVLRFNESSIANNLMLKIGERYIWEGKQQKTSVVLTSSLYDFAYMVSKDTLMKTVNILMPGKWLKKMLGTNVSDDLWQTLKELNTATSNLIPFDKDYKILFEQLLINDDTEVHHASLEKLVVSMVKKFVSELALKFYVNAEREKIKISADEVQRLMKVEAYLVRDFSKAPPPITFLSRIGAMSTTSLKNKFKKMYGSSLYEYFQQRRMQRAKVLMLTHKYSIKEIGSQLGYLNLSNFSIAFKKEFKILPSNVNGVVNVK